MLQQGSDTARGRYSFQHDPAEHYTAEELWFCLRSGTRWDGNVLNVPSKHAEAMLQREVPRDPHGH